MYHYVRPPSDRLKDLKYLHIENFRRQLDWIATSLGFVNRETFFACVDQGRPTSGAILTFDDGLKDHFDFVLPELKARNLWGIFYVPTGAIEAGALLDVHRIHAILACHSGAAAMDAALRVIRDDMLRDSDVEEFRRRTYLRQINDEETVLFKRTFNYYIAPAFRTDVLKQLTDEFFGPGGECELAKLYYLDRSQIRRLHDEGMLIGSHTVTHPVMSRLSPDEQRWEIQVSFACLAEVIDAPIRTYCHPYGGFQTFTQQTERLLEASGSLFAFNVERRDIEDADLMGHPQALPRYDCNYFPFGTAGMAERD